MFKVKHLYLEPQCTKCGTRKDIALYIDSEDYVWLLCKKCSESMLISLIWNDFKSNTEKG